MCIDPMQQSVRLPTRGAPPNLRVFDLAPREESVREEVIAGLSATPKSLPPKLFYDTRGSALFTAICETPAYYPTRTESAILRQHADEIAAAVGHGCVLLEPGAGDLKKVRLLLEALRPRLYAAFDISREPMVSAAADLARGLPWLRVDAVHADYLRSGIDFLDLPARARRIVFFPGSSIGNYDPVQAEGMLRQLRTLVGDDGGILIGVDLRKAKAVLELAYNDPGGLTAEFNLNVLARINGELGADFDLGAFAHSAFYSEPRGRIEMHLVSRTDQVVSMGERQFEFRRGESVHTENSYKYTPEGFASLAHAAGFAHHQLWTDPARWFGVFLLTQS